MHVSFSLLVPLRRGLDFTCLHNAKPIRSMQRQICRTAWRTQVKQIRKRQNVMPADTQGTGVGVQGHFEDLGYTVGELTTSHSLRP